MEKKPYRIVFGGKLKPGAKPSEVLRNLAALYKTSPEQIKSLLSKRGALMGQASDIVKAKSMVQRLGKAGVLCAILGPDGMPISPPKTPGPATSAEPLPEQPSPPATAAPRPSGIGGVVKLEPAGMDISLSPIQCNRFTAVPGGIGTSRIDHAQINYSEIRALSAFKPSPMEQDFKLLLFVFGSKRPFVASGNSIAFGDFPGVAGSTLPDSLRNFISFLHEQNPGITLDEATHSFITGGPQPIYAEDPLSLVTSFHNALPPDESSALSQQAPPEAASREPESGANMITCPKCGRTQPRGRRDCIQCGLIFKRWDPRSQKVTGLEQIASFSKRIAEEQTSGIAASREADEWITHWARVCGFLLLLGFALPLLKQSMVFQKTFIIWPWNIMGFGLSPAKTTAMAIYSKGNNYLLWSIVPLITGAAAIGLSFLKRKTVKAICLFAAGLITFGLLGMAFMKEAVLLGTPFLPSSLTGGIIDLVYVLAAGCIAGGNHLARRFPGSHLSRTLMGAGGVIFGLMTLFPIVGADGHWHSWPMYIVYFLFFCYAGLGINEAIRSAPDETLISITGYAARVIVPLALLAAIIAETYYTDPAIRYVLSGGGGLLHNASTMLKTACLYLGSAFLILAGLTAFLEFWFIRKTSTE